MDDLTLRLMGVPQVALDGVTIRFESQKAAALLCYLAVETNQPHQRADLAALLWPRATPRAARQSLSQALTTLRATLAMHTSAQARASVFLVDSDTIHLDRSAAWTLDVQQFQTLAATIAAHHHYALRTCLSCGAQLRQLTKLYRGDFLDQFTLHDSAPFEEWVLLWRERLRMQAQRAFGCLADVAEWREEYGRAHHYLRQQGALDPFNEEYYRATMRLLALSGQPSAALAQYDQVAQLLARELGTVPDQATRALRDQIGGASVARSSLRRYYAPLMHVPAPPTALIGREAELHALRQQLLVDQHRLVTIIGPPGIGKTSLAQTATAAARFDFSDGVVFVELAAITDATLVPSAIARALEIAERDGESITTTLLAALRARHMLLTLDNFEHVLDAAPLVADLLTACPTLTLLVTSHATLAIDGEHVFPLDVLAVPPEGASLATIAQAPAVQLFVDRARAVRADFTLTAHNAGTIAAICARCDGLPLALELVAAQLATCAPNELLQRLATPLDVFVDGPRDLPERQQTLRSAIQWSVARLPTDVQRVYAVLGVFTGGFTEEAAQAVVGDLLPVHVVLQQLTHTSLIRAPTTAAAPRYTMLETLREAARELLEATGLLDQVCTSHARYYAQLVERTRTSTTQLLTEYENLLAALGWALAHDLPAAALPLGVGVAQVWVRNRSWVSGLAWLNALLARQHAVSPAGVVEHPGVYPYLQRWAAQHVAWAAQQPDLRLIRLARLGLALVHQAHGHYHATQRLFEAALAGPTTESDRFPLALLAELCARTRQFDAATQHYTQCVHLNQTCGDAEGTAQALLGLAFIAGEQHAWRDAASYGEAALHLYASLDHQHGVAHLLCILGTISFGRGDPASAIAQHCQSFALCANLHDTAGCADVFEALAPLLSALGHTNLLVRVLGGAAALRRADGTHLTTTEHARLVVLRQQCARQLGAAAFAQHWQAASTVSGEQFLALIEEVRGCAVTPIVSS